MSRPIRTRSLVSRGGEAGDLTTFAALPPPEYAGYLVTGTVRISADGPTFEVIRVSHKETGAQVELRGDAGVLTVPGESEPAEVAKLWKDARYLAGWAQSTRPAERDARIQAIVDAARELGDAATRNRVAEVLGRSDEQGVANSDYKRDVREAGGWAAIRRRARGM